jgi:hypothetical protein
VFFLFRNYKTEHAKTEFYKEKMEKVDSYYKLMIFRENSTIRCNGTHLFADMILRGETKIVRLSDFIKDGEPKIIMRYSALACDICLDEELKQIHDFVERIGVNNIAVFVSNENARSIKVRKSRLPFNLNTYIVDDTAIAFEKNYNNLFVFIIDKEMIVKDFFIPEKTLPNLSKDYYDAICSKYW